MFRNCCVRQSLPISRPGLWEAMSKELLKGGTSSTNVVAELLGYTFGSREANERALGHPELKARLKPGFDVVVCQFMVFSEGCYHLAHRSGASLATFMTLQVEYYIYNLLC